MGFRSTFISEVIIEPLPNWFKDKYKEVITFFDKGNFASYGEHKTYYLDDLITDLQKALLEIGCFKKNSEKYDRKFVLVYLHECGGITRVEIHKEKIFYTEPTDWIIRDLGIEHDHCYGCSDASNYIKE